MSEGNASGSSNPTSSKAVPSFAKKQSDVTRLGTQKLKFVPTLPSRRKKEEGKPDEAPAPSASSSSTDRGRGRGRGRDDRGRGRGRGEAVGRGAAPPRPPAVEMTASGPFALGPAMAGSAATRRTAPRSNVAPVMPRGAERGAIGASLTNSTAPSIGLKGEPNDLNVLKKEGASVDDGGEVYSDPDEGVEIIDMENVRGMDWMAPESLRKEKDKGKRKKLKQEESDKKGKGDAKPDVDASESAPRARSVMDVDEEGSEGESKVNLANALNLSDSEEEEELEHMVEDFTHAMDMTMDEGGAHERLYFFQFPHPFPQFISPTAGASEDKGRGKESEDSAGTVSGKKVSFAPDVKPAIVPTGNTPGKPGAKQEDQESGEKLEGVIGQLEVYASGAVKMRLTNGIVMDVTPSTQPSFLQHAVYLDPENKRLCVLGEVNRRFVVSPDVQTLLDSLEKAEAVQVDAEVGGFDGLISMDTT